MRNFDSVEEESECEGSLLFGRKEVLNTAIGLLGLLRTIQPGQRVYYKILVGVSVNLLYSATERFLRHPPKSDLTRT